MRGVLTYLKKNKKYLLFSFLPILVLICSLVIFLINQKLPEVRQVLDKTPKGRFPTIGLSPSPVASITLIFTGDVIPARSVNSTMVRLNNFKYPFEKTADFLKNADLTIINLEAPLIKNCPVTDIGMVFCVNERFIEGLIFAGIDVVTLANNHSSNYGEEGIENTVRLLWENGILATGVNNIIYKEIKGVRFSFLGFNGVSPFVDKLDSIDKENILDKITKAKKNSDFIIVLYHWGKEYSPTPEADMTVSPYDPVEFGRFAIDSGADLVIGNHPHVIQGYEIYKEKPIFYALGNFIFDQIWSYQTRIGYVLKVDFTANRISSFSFHPVRIDNFAQPVFVEGEEKEKILEKIKNLN